MKKEFMGIPCPKNVWLALVMGLILSVQIIAVEGFLDVRFGDDTIEFLVFVTAHYFTVSYSSYLVVRIRHRRVVKESSKKLEITEDETDEIVGQDEYLQAQLKNLRFLIFLVLILSTSIIGGIEAHALTV